MSAREFQTEDEEQRSFGLLRVANVLADITISNDGSIEAYAERVRAAIAQVTKDDSLDDLRRSAKERRLDSEVARSLRALAVLDRPATCEEISPLTARHESVVRVYNTNRALKRVPELAHRITAAGDKVRYHLTNSGRAFVDLVAP